MENRIPLYLRCMHEEFWLSSEELLGEDNQHGKSVYFRTGCKVLFSCSPTWFQHKKEAIEAAEAMNYRVVDQT